MLGEWIDIAFKIFYNLRYEGFPFVKLGLLGKVLSISFSISKSYLLELEVKNS